MTNVNSLLNIQEQTGIPVEFLSETPVMVNKEIIDSIEGSFQIIFEKMQELFHRKSGTCNKYELGFLERYSGCDEMLSIDKHLIGRPDGVINGNKVSYFELNITPSIGGMEAFTVIQKYFENQLKTTLPTPINALSLYIKELGRTGVYRKNGYEERIDQEDEALVKLIADSGSDCEYLDLSELEGRLEDFDAILRFHSYADSTVEILKMIDKLEAESYLSGKTVVLGRDKSDYLFSKVFLSFFSEYVDDNDYVVWSRWLGNEVSKNEEKYIKLMSYALENKNELVIKKDSSNRGRHVFFGNEVSKQKWGELLEITVRDGDWILQKNGLSAEREFNINGKIEMKKFILSPYFFGSNYGGCCIRVVLDDERKVCAMPGETQTAVTTLIEERQ
jgi:hypothetical protein